MRRASPRLCGTWPLTATCPRHKWRFVAYLDGPEGEEVIGHKGEFWGSSFKLDSSTTVAKNALRDLLHTLAKDGWELWGDGSLSRGREWYSHRLYRDRASPRHTSSPG